MREKFPIHVMIKPEGLEHFPDQIRDGIRLFERRSGAEEIFHMVTTISPEQVDLIYRDEGVSDDLRVALSGSDTEHHVFHGPEGIYDAAREMKGKMNPPHGLRGHLKELAADRGLRFERWQNFIHTADSLEATRHICNNLLGSYADCSNCVGKELCHKPSEKK